MNTLFKDFTALTNIEPSKIYVAVQDISYELGVTPAHSNDIERVGRLAQKFRFPYDIEKFAKYIIPYFSGFDLLEGKRTGTKVCAVTKPLRYQCSKELSLRVRYIEFLVLLKGLVVAPSIY